jgi:UPF0176 protein
MTFYRFVDLENPEALRDELETQARELGLSGTVLLASEGINGTLSGERAALERFAADLSARAPFVGIPCKYSGADPDNPVFYRLKVKVKPEIVALGRPDVRPQERTGTHVDAGTWNALLEDPEVIVIDTRNDYEIAIGTFPGSVDPETVSFKQFPEFVAGLDAGAHPRVAMFCTGGIRCEKASAYMLEQGFEAVYQLDGGILRYLETVPPGENRWQGDCFVFDQRVSVDRDLEEGRFEQCFACRHPLSPEDLDSPAYRQGVSCPYCVDRLDERRRQSLEERQRQVELAEQRQDRHVGKVMTRS